MPPHSSRPRRRILFVHGLDTTARARDVAHEFERYGRIVRCDIPPPRDDKSQSLYAFVEYEDARDAEDAYHRLHGKRFEHGVFKIQWAKRPPAANRRSWDERRGGRSRSPRRSPGRSRSPRRSPSPRGRRSRSPSAGRRSPSRSASPVAKTTEEETIKSPQQNGNDAGSHASSKHSSKPVSPIEETDQN